MKSGDIFFAKKARRDPSRPSTEMTFKGHVFGVMLGHVPPHKPAPSETDCLRLMGAIGYITFDDIEKMLGKETLDLLISKCEAKYNPTLPAVDASENPPPQILDPSGAPVETAPQ